MSIMKIVSLLGAPRTSGREEMLQNIRRVITPLCRDVDQLREDVDKLMEGKTT